MAELYAYICLNGKMSLDSQSLIRQYRLFQMQTLPGKRWSRSHGESVRPGVLGMRVIEGNRLRRGAIFFSILLGFVRFLWNICLSDNLLKIGKS